MSYRYRDFSKLMQKWPLDISKSETNRDLGAYIRQKIKEAYKQGQYNHISNQKLCDNIFKNLSDIADDKYLKLYPRNKSLIGSTGLSKELCDKIMSDNMLNIMQYRRLSLYRRIKIKLSTVLGLKLNVEKRNNELIKLTNKL
ncbi:unnamed protein product [Gordionus sp. m RMFG-2023]